jgi:integrase/recombinase XerC
MSMQKRPVRAEWNVPIEGWSTAQRAARRATSTIAVRREILSQLSRERTESPWELTTSDLVEWLGAEVWDSDLNRLRPRWSTERQRMVRSTLVGFYRWAHGVGLVAADVALDLPTVRAAHGIPRPAPHEVYTAAYAAAGPRERLMLRLANELGMRRAEVAQVHTSDVVDDGFASSSLIVHGKGSRNRIVPLSAELAATLREQDPGFLFPGSCDGHLSPRWVGTLVARLLPGHHTMHALRHSFATGVVEDEPNLIVAQQLLGHRSLATTQRYVKPNADLMRAAVEKRRRRLTEIQT